MSDSPDSPLLSRRRFLNTCAVVAGGLPLVARAKIAPNTDWAGEVGVTTSSLFRQMTPGVSDRMFELDDLPRVMRDELGMKVIDINSGTLGAPVAAKLDRFRKAVEDAGCVVTNVKVNATKLGIKDLDLPIDHPDAEVRRKAVEGYRDWILAASRIGARWLRPYMSNDRPEFSVVVESLEKLVEFSSGHGVGIVLENGGWMQEDPEAIPRLISALGGRIAAAPDTGSWETATREKGLELAFPHAVTCDFKVGRLGPAGQHTSYNLKRCFDQGWKAGFRGPWCIEHNGDKAKELFRELIWIRDQLKTWMGQTKSEE